MATPSLIDGFPFGTRLSLERLIDFWESQDGDGDRAGVDKLYAKAIELGASDEGEPGERMPVFYGAYVRDLDGNKLCFFEMNLG